MSGSGTSGVVPGWYADPYDGSQLRWWDGTQWTDHVAPAVAPATTATSEVVEPAAEPAIAQPTPAEPVATHEPVASQEPVPAQETPLSTDAYTTPMTTSFGADVAPLPSRRALREAAAASAAEVALPMPAADSLHTAEPGFSAEPAPSEQPAADAEPTASAAFGTPTELSAPPAETPAAPTLESLMQEQLVVPPVEPLTEAPATADYAPAPQAWNPPPASQPAWEQPVAPSLPPASIDSLVAGPIASQEPAPFSIPSAEAAPANATALADLRPRENRSDASNDPVEGTSTVWAWLTAVSPVLAAAAIGYELHAGGFSATNLLLIIAIVAPYILVILFAVADRSRLQVVGHQAASWTWAALTAPVYLIVRAMTIRRNTGSGAGFGPMVACLVCVVLGVVGLVLYGVATGHALIPGLPS